MNADPTPRILVVGGGVSGLVAARDLARSGAEVVLFERGDRPGGRIRREVLAGVPVDVGAEAFATRGGAVSELLGELGLENEIVSPAPLGSWVVAGERAVPLPAAGTLGIPVAPLSPASRRALGLPGALRAAIEPLLPRAVGGGRGTLGDLVRARLGKRVLERLVRPVALGVHSADPAELAVSSVPGLPGALERRGSLIAAARELRASSSAAGGAVAGLRGGMTALVEALLADLGDAGVAVRTGVAVDRVEREDESWTAFDANGQQLDRGNAVILAVSEEAAGSLLGGPARSGSSSVRVEVVALALDEPRLDSAPRGTGALVAAEPGSRSAGAASPPRIVAKALTHVTAKWPERAQRAGSGLHIVRLSYGRAGNPPETAGLGDAAVQRLALQDASRILGVDLRRESLRGMLRREWLTAPPRNTSRDVSAVPVPHGVFVAGDWVGGTGLASVIPAARAAADQALRMIRETKQARTTEHEGAPRA